MGVDGEKERMVGSDDHMRRKWKGKAKSTTYAEFVQFGPIDQPAERPRPSENTNPDSARMFKMKDEGKQLTLIVFPCHASLHTNPTDAFPSAFIQRRLFRIRKIQPFTMLHTKRLEYGAGFPPFVLTRRTCFSCEIKRWDILSEEEEGYICMYDL